MANTCHNQRPSTVRFDKGENQSLYSDGQIRPCNYIRVQIRSSGRASPTVCVNESNHLGSTEGPSGCVYIATVISIIHLMLTIRSG